MDKIFSILGATTLENINVMFKLQQALDLPISIEQKERLTDDLHVYEVKSDKVKSFRLEWFIDTADIFNKIQSPE